MQPATVIAGPVLWESVSGVAPDGGSRYGMRLIPPVTIQQAFELAVQNYQAGRVRDAEIIFRQILQVQPSHPDALRWLSLIAQRVGRFADALELIGQALILNPQSIEYLNDSGNILNALGRPNEAATAYRKALEISPNHHVLLNGLGNALLDQRQFEAALVAYRAALLVAPDFAEAHHNVATVLHEQGKYETALAGYQLALRLKPQYASAYRNMANTLRVLKRAEEALGALQNAWRLEPANASIENSLGVLLHEIGRTDEANEAFRRAVALDPGDLTARSNLASGLTECGELAAAIEGWRHILTRRPDDVRTHSNLAYMLLFDPCSDSAALLCEARRWNDQHAAPWETKHSRHANSPEPERRLRIGYVSPDFCHHVIRHFLIPLLEAHDHAHFEIYCYASVKQPDPVTDRLRKTADVWRNVLGIGDEALAEKIREDQIDILVDLTQHMADNRLLVFARKPAPVQVAWLGYPGSTGLQAMDYRLTDALMEPEGSVWSESDETPIRLPDSWFCFDPIDDYPEPGPLPALLVGHVTFGSLNHFRKINEGVLRLWIQVLQSVDGSRLLIQCPAGSAQTRVRQWFEVRGIAPHRLELVARTATRAEFLQLFDRIDIGLETFPYNGGTTTCEALWMGLPVPTFPGKSIVSRIGLSILSAAGLQELITSNQDEYVRLTASFAKDLPRLATLRSTLRQRMKSSAFMDAPRFARNVEQVYRQVWRTWCANQSSPLPS